jgi:small subunit ribosomal protein S9
MPRKKKITVAPEPKVDGAPQISEPPVEAAPKTGFYFGHGRRKTASARARLYLPSQEVIINGQKLTKGDIYVNNLPITKYFNSPFAASYNDVFQVTNTVGRFITTIIVSGSGKTGQLGASILAIANSLVKVDPNFRPLLRKGGFLTRDPRAKERKKPGLMGARKEKQSPKR